jgi:hypothetical protein
LRINIDNNNNNNQVSNIKEERDLELENIIGNLMVAQFQVDKLRHRLSERITGYGSVRNKKKHLLTYSKTMTNGIKLQ